MKHNFKIGDVVVLNGGSVDMRVTSFTEDDVIVQFTAIDGSFQTSRFFHETVRLVQPFNAERYDIQEQNAWSAAREEELRPTVTAAIVTPEIKTPVAQVINVGDIVTCEPDTVNGLPMTVEAIADGAATVTWTDDHGEVHTETIAVDQLSHIVPAA